MGNNRALREHWIRRIFAAIIDAILLGVVVAIVAIFFFVGRLTLGLYNPLFGGIGYVPFGLFALVYFTLFEGLSSHTPGKALLGLKVTAHLESMGLAKAFIRNLSKIWLPLLLIDLIIGFVLDGDPRQRFLDRLSGTTVVRTGTAALEEEQFHRPQYSGSPGQGTGGPVAESPTWPQHELDPQGEPVKQTRFCSACGGPLVPRGDGRLTCTRCGAAY
jgi:uncharacterized RDD family membrane protein YckC/ribosomal protein S27AE